MIPSYSILISDYTILKRNSNAREGAAMESGLSEENAHS